MRYVPLVTISGMVTGPDGPAGNYNLRLVSSEAGEISSNPESASSTTDSTGAFMFLGVPAGQYVIQTMRLPREGREFADLSSFNVATRVESVAVTFNGQSNRQPSEPLLFAQTPIAVGDADISGIGLTLQEGLTIRGRFEFTGSKPKPDAQRLTQIPLILEPAEGMEIDVENGPPSRSRARRPVPDGGASAGKVFSARRRRAERVHRAVDFRERRGRHRSADRSDAERHECRHHVHGSHR